VTSYNVKLFDVYTYRNNPEIKTHNKIYRFLENNPADIICFQEFYTEDEGEMAVLDTLLKLQPAKNYHVDFFQTLRKEHHWGIATFSRFPVLNRQRHQFRNSTGNYCILTDILYQQDTLRIINTHLESWHFEHNDYKLFRVMKNQNIKEEDTLQQGLKNIYWKIENAYLKRAVQIEELKTLVQQSEHPVIVCGDFNDTPLSYTYHMMNSQLKDAFREKGKGLGKTYRDGLPYFRIDYIFHDEAFETAWFKTHHVPYSDHYPVSTVLNYQKK
jgi:endonuclease/exonuclease/phosphatase family metal-dependent hydrolase